MIQLNSLKVIAKRLKSDVIFCDWLRQISKKVLGTLKACIFNQIKSVCLTWIKMLNIGYKKEAGPSTNAFPVPRHHHSILRHFGDMLNTFARLNIARGSGGSHFPLKMLEFFKTFFEDCRLQRHDLFKTRHR